MASSACVLLFDFPRRYDALAQKLEAEGYASLVAHDLAEARSLVRRADPDIAIVTGGDGAGMDAVPAVLAAARPETPLPLIVIEAAPVDEDVNRDGADAMIEFLVEPFSDVQLFSRLQSLSRLVTMQREMARRGETALRCGVERRVEVVEPEKVVGAQILILAGSDLNVAEIHAVLGRDAVLAVVDDPHTALSRLEGGTFDAVLVYASAKGFDWLRLSHSLRQNTQLYNLPLLVIADGGAYRDLDAAYEAGVTDMLRADTPADEIAFRTLSVVQMQRYRRAIQKLHREARDEAISDAPTGLYNRAFLLAHLEAQLGDAAGRDKALGLGYLEIADLVQVGERLGAEVVDRIVAQVGGLMGALIRGEDLAARFDAHRFCVVFPNTDEAQARQVLRRIAAVINNTTLEIPALEAPIGVHVATGCASRVGDETPAALTDRAKADLSD